MNRTLVESARAIMMETSVQTVKTVTDYLCGSKALMVNFGQESYFADLVCSVQHGHLQAY